jgi:hypothetical protein
LTLLRPEDVGQAPGNIAFSGPEPAGAGHDEMSGRDTTRISPSKGGFGWLNAAR